MERIIPSRETFLQKPRRISRVYPILALALSIASSGLTYGFVVSRLNRETEIAKRDSEISFLENQVSSLTAQTKSDAESIKKTTDQLNATAAKLSSTTAALAEKEKSLASTQAQIKNQEAQLSSNASELEKLRSRPPLFNFESVTVNAARNAAVKELITNAYDVITEVYGQPYLLNQITIAFVDNLSLEKSSGETTIETGPKGVSITIRLKDFSATSFQDVNTVIHEVIHGFHGVAVFDSSAFEEGITVAATDIVMDRMAAKGMLSIDQRYIGITAARYESWNKSLKIPEDNAEFYTSQQIGEIYQEVGYAWREIGKQDSDIFKKLNNLYYKDVQLGKSPSDALIRKHLITLLPKVNGIDTATWIAGQQALNPQ